MTQCANPGCSRNDETANSQMFLEYMERGEVWVGVCTKHANHDNPTIRVTDEVKEIPVGTLTQLKDDLTE